MFTGLVEEVGTVLGVTDSGDGKVIDIDADLILDGIRTGDSISVNGACQTVTSTGRHSFTVFASRITCSVTTLGAFRSGSRVNLERAMTPSSRMGGHIVQGHVDGTGIIRRLRPDPNGLEVEVEIPEEISRYIVPKGSVAVDGVSLTVVSCGHGAFSLYLIPETLKNTIIPGWKTGDRVNIETDILAKYVERMLGKKENSDESLMKKLQEGGFTG